MRALDLSKNIGGNKKIAIERRGAFYMSDDNKISWGKTELIFAQMCASMAVFEWNGNGYQ